MGLILITFATTKERVTPPPQQTANVREELAGLVCYYNSTKSH